jgi:Domain of unknown function (DUF4411)
VSYVLDSSFIIQLHKHYYRESFPSMWKLFDEMVGAGAFTSTREVFRELEDSGDAAAKWAVANNGLFATPNAAEGAFVAGIYAVPHFQANIERQKLFKGGKNADPFVIARAHAVNGTVLTMEQIKPHAAKIPNICDHFRVPCLDLRGFMLAEGWKF